MSSNREKQLIKNTFIITIGKVSTQMVNFLLLPLYTAFLSTEEYGTVDMVISIALLLAPIVTFQAEQGMFRMLIDAREKKDEQICIVSSTFFAFTLQLTVFILMYVWVTWGIRNDSITYLLLYVISYNCSTMLLQYTRGNGDNLSYTYASSIIAMITVIGNVLFITVFRMESKGMLLASILAYFIGAVYIFVRKKVLYYLQLKKIKWETIKKIWFYSIPLIPNAISWWVFSASDRLIVNIFLGVSSNGVLAVAHKFSQVYVAIYNIFNISWTESASMHICDRDAKEYISKIINICIRIFTALCLLIIAFMPFGFRFMVHENFGEAYRYIPILMFAALGNVGVGVISVVYIALKDTKTIARTSVMSAMINCVTHVLLIHSFGLYAACISTFVAYYTMFVYRYNNIKNKFNIYIEKRIIISAIVVSCIVTIAYHSDAVIIQVGGIVIALGYALVINRKSIGFFKQVITDRLKRAS